MEYLKTELRIIQDRILAGCLHYSQLPANLTIKGRKCLKAANSFNSQTARLLCSCLDINSFSFMRRLRGLGKP
jgi:hypothetical protein